MADTYQRLLTQDATLAPGQWRAVDPRAIAAKAIVACKRCGGIDELDDSYDIQPDGRVVPRWHCPTATCGETTWLVLEGYE